MGCFLVRTHALCSRSSDPYYDIHRKGNCVLWLGRFSSSCRMAALGHHRWPARSSRKGIGEYLRTRRGLGHSGSSRWDELCVRVRATTQPAFSQFYILDGASENSKKHWLDSRTKLRKPPSRALRGSLKNQGSIEIWAGRLTAGKNKPPAPWTTCDTNEAYLQYDRYGGPEC